MRQIPGFLAPLQNSFESLTLDVLERVNRPGGFETSDLIEHLLKPTDNSIYDPKDVSTDRVLELRSYPEGIDHFFDRTAAYCILAGDVDSEGRPLALKLSPDSQRTLLDIKLQDAIDIPIVWVMTSPSHHDVIKAHASRYPNVRCFNQYETFKLTPDNRLIASEFETCGSGDVIPSLIHNGILRSFLDANGRYIQLVNVANVAARPNRDLMSMHTTLEHPITVEVVRKKFEDVGPTVCDHQGFDVVCEDRHIVGPEPAQRFTWTCTGTIVLDADMDWKSVPWRWDRTKRRTSGSLVVHYERNVYDLTHFFRTNYIEVDRDERYVPCV